jgi:hypothetical protein
MIDSSSALSSWQAASGASSDDAYESCCGGGAEFSDLPAFMSQGIADCGYV